MAHIYRIVRNGTDQCYVGHTVELKTRWWRHKNMLGNGDHHSSYLQRAWNKDGASSFTFEVIEECLVEDMLDREQFWMDSLNSCFNGRPAAGSNLGYKYTDDQKARMSLAQQNSPFTGQHRLGVKDGPEIIEKRRLAIIAALAERPTVWITDGLDNMRYPASDPIPDGWRLSRTFSEEHKAATLAASSGPRSPEVRANIKAGHATTWGDPEKRAAMMVNRKPFGWWTDGTTSKRVPLDEAPPAGWVSGRTTNPSWAKAGRKPGSKLATPVREKAPPAPLTPEHIEKMQTARQAVRDAAPTRIWITDGVHNRQVEPSDPVPDGWFVSHTLSPEGRASTAAAATRMLTEDGEASRRGSIAWQNEDSRAALLASRQSQGWITNGTETKRHFKSQPVPDGWRRGRGGLFGRAAAKAKQAQPEDLMDATSDALLL